MPSHDRDEQRFRGSVVRGDLRPFLRAPVEVPCGGVELRRVRLPWAARTVFRFDGGVGFVAYRTKRLAAALEAAGWVVPRG